MGNDSKHRIMTELRNNKLHWVSTNENADAKNSYVLSNISRVVNGNFEASEILSSFYMIGNKEAEMLVIKLVVSDYYPQ